MFSCREVSLAMQWQGISEALKDLCLPSAHLPWLPPSAPSAHHPWLPPSAPSAQLPRPPPSAGGEECLGTPNQIILALGALFGSQFSSRGTQNHQRQERCM